MKPYILKFGIPLKKLISNNDIIYSKELNLNILNSTREVAVNNIVLSTKTSTHTLVESSDSDIDHNYLNFLSTMTKTGDHGEKVEED